MNEQSVDQISDRNVKFSLIFGCGKQQKHRWLVDGKKIDAQEPKIKGFGRMHGK
jgi:hypothetical protein